MQSDQLSQVIGPPLLVFVSNEQSHLYNSERIMYTCYTSVISKIGERSTYQFFQFYLISAKYLAHEILTFLAYLFPIGPKEVPEKSGTVLPQVKESMSIETNQFPPTPPSSVPSPSSPLSPETHQLHSPSKAVSGEPLTGLQSEVPSAFDFSSAPHYPQSPPLPSPESLRSNTSSPSASEDGHNAPLKPKQTVFSNITELSLWKCGQCNKSFPQRTMLQVHVCNESPHKPYQCGHCALSFSRPAELRAHAVSHASKKPFKCGYCSRAFAGATTLNNHIRTHTGEKPFVCDKCGKNFTQGSQLSRHQRIPGDCVPEA